MWKRMSWLKRIGVIGTNRHRLEYYCFSWVRACVEFSCLWETHLSPVKRHVPYRITKCYLPLDRRMHTILTPTRQART